MFYTIFNTRLCKIALIGNEDGLRQIILLKDSTTFSKKEKLVENDDFFDEARNQIEDYLAGRIKFFNLKIMPIGTTFQKRVWQAVSEIPYGKTASYLDVAKMINNPKACRAVGNANNKNPLPLIIPCHRVISNNGELGGYGAGSILKKQLLNIEGCFF